MHFRHLFFGNILIYGQIKQECTVRIERLDVNFEEVNQLTEKENSNTLNKIDENNGQVANLPARRYSTRSSVNRIDSTETNGYIQRKERSVSKPQTKPQFIDYKGKVEYYTEFHDIAFASDNLL